MKGKEAAAAARRRVQELEAEVLELQRRMAERAQEAHDREVALKEENARLAGRLDRDVKAIADARVAEALEQGKQALAELEQRHDDRLGQIAAELVKHNDTVLNHETWTSVGKLLRRKPGEWISPDGNRAMRRMDERGMQSQVQINHEGGDRAITKWQKLAKPS